MIFELSNQIDKEFMEATDGPDAADTCACCNRPAAKMKNWYELNFSSFNLLPVVNSAGLSIAVRAFSRRDPTRKTTRRGSAVVRSASHVTKSSFTET